LQKQSYRRESKKKKKKKNKVMYQLIMKVRAQKTRMLK